MFFIVHHDSASISSCETQFCQRINADWSCVHGLGRKKLRAKGEMPPALGTSLFLGTVMDLLVLERAPLGATRNGIWTRRGVVFILRGYRIFNFRSTRRVPGGRLPRSRKVAVYIRPSPWKCKRKI